MWSGADFNFWNGTVRCGPVRFCLRKNRTVRFGKAAIMYKPHRKKNVYKPIVRYRGGVCITVCSSPMDYSVATVIKRYEGVGNYFWAP